MLSEIGKKAMPCPVFNQMKNKETFNNLSHKQPTIEAIDSVLMQLNIRKSSPHEDDGNDRHERRVQVIRLRKVGHTYEAIAAQNGLSHTGVFNICQRHANSGVKALRDAVGGRKTGEFRILTAEQERQVQQLIRNKTPDQIELSYALWSRVVVSELIADRFGMRIPVRTMGTYLKCWGFY